MNLGSKYFLGDLINRHIP